MKRIHLLFVMLLASFASRSQLPMQTIRGRVSDQASSAAIPFASVVLLNTSPILGTTSDAEGNFVIERIPVGRYDLQVSFMGYESALIKEVTVSSSKETFLEVQLKESVISLGEIVIRPNVSKELPLNNMATVSARMFSVEEARRYAGGFDDPARLASSFAGVASSMGNNGIVVRGNAPKSLQWKMEGVEIPNPNHFADLAAFGGGGLTALSSQMLANSDFFTGAFPAEYGNALSGVFDIAMRNGSNQKHEHTFQAGIVGIDFASEGPLKTGKRASYLFNYRYSTLALVAPLLPDDAQGTSYQDLAFKFYLPTPKAGIFTLWGLGLQDHSGQTAETDSTKWVYLQDKEDGDAEQYMAATGVTHSVFISKSSQLKTTLAATVSGLDWKISRMNNLLELRPQNEIVSQNWNFVFNSALNNKFSARHTNKTGIVLTGLRYDMLLKDALQGGQPLTTVTDENGLSALLSAYSSSSLQLTNRLTLNIGLNAQFFALNNNYAIEPRIGSKFQISEKQSIGFGYGLHSRLERLNYYFTQSNETPNVLINKDMDFTKAHHFILSYTINLSENLLLKIEPYYQHLFSVPVIADSSFSFINLQNEWFFSHELVNTGKGRNYGLELTLEKYLTSGHYFLFTASAFDSKYTGGDGIWRETRYNRNYLLNLLGGKEWYTGKNKQNVLGINARLSFQGGDRYTPVDQPTSLEAEEAVFLENQAFSKQLSPAFVAHFTMSYKRNKPKSAHEIALKIVNATMYKDFYGYRYNFASRSVDIQREAIMIPNLSYRIDF